MNENELWGIPGVIHYPHNQKPYASTDYRALADAYIHNTQNEYQQRFANVPQNYSYEGGTPVQPNQVVQPSINDQVSSTIAYLNEPYTPYDYNNLAQRMYEGTPRYQQVLDRLTMTPRESALGSASRLPQDVREMW